MVSMDRKTYHIQLSYNASELNLGKRYAVENHCKLTIEQLLTVLLKDFKINIRETTPQKLLLQVDLDRNIPLKAT